MAETQAPQGTGPAGKAIRAAISGNFDLEPHNTQVLRQIATSADRIKQLGKVVVRDGVIVEGRTHPTLSESRLQPVTLGWLLPILRLLDWEDRRPRRRGGFRGHGTVPAYRTLAHVLQPLVWNAPSLPLIVTVVGPPGFPLAIIAAKSPLVSFNRDQ